MTGATAAAIHAASASDVVAAVHDAAGRGGALRIVGAGTWLDAGRPVRAGAVPLDISALRGVTEYNPGDLTIAVRAGTTLAEVDAATAEHRQWCPLLPWGRDGGTIGATIATATAGPCAGALGLPRDLVLGAEFVDGRGSMVRAGGRVVKNVAGFDLVRLVTGAWGTLGVITHLNLRLRARPAVDETWSVAVERLDDTAVARIDALRLGPYLPLAAEFVNDALARHLGLGDTPQLLVRLGGNAHFVAAARAAVLALGSAAEHPGTAWASLRAAEPARASTWRESGAPSRWPLLARSVMRRGADGSRAVHAHLSLARGVLRVSTLLDTGDDPLRAGAAWRTSMRCVRERPAADDAGGDLTGAHRVAGADALARRVREAFDPNGVLNPGILA
ncbi:MAG: FAD-binding oxidoreductase [Gemmatimonadetes bacterium]|nr:FAD-binding oxidoreductase [Gemmatimonadota bacterium]